MGYFDNNYGVVRERWVSTSSTGWFFSVTLFDGDYVDQKFVTMSMYIGSLQDEMTIQQWNGYNLATSNK